MRRRLIRMTVVFSLLVITMTAFSGCVARYAYAAPQERVVVVHHPYRVAGIRYHYHPVRVVYVHPKPHRH